MCLNCGCMAAHDDMGMPEENITFEVVKRAADANGMTVEETLAMIAYRQPITRTEVEYLRGVDSGGVLKTLLEKKMVRILGKKDVPGKPLIYGSTREFLEVFNLPDLASLPTLKDIHELADQYSDIEQAELPLEAAGAEQDES